jgi:endonuclease/exonuclease/phosphatase family metal-dependent hydrolase
MTQTAQPTLRVATYNVHGCVGIDWRRSELRIAEVIASLGVDVVGLQELNLRRPRSGVVDQAAVIAKQLGWNALFQPALQNPDEDLGDAIISRYPLRLVRAAELPGPSPWYCREPRVALWAEVETELGSIQVMNTHLGLGRTERRMQAQWLVGPDWLGGLPPDVRLVMLGDLNCLPGSQPYRCLTSRLHDVRESMLAKTRPGTFPTYFPALEVDHIFVNDALHPVNVHVHRTMLTRIASDHFPLVAELRNASAVELAMSKQARLALMKDWLYRLI